MATPVVNELSELYRAADVGAIASLMSRLGKFVPFCLILSFIWTEFLIGQNMW